MSTCQRCLQTISSCLGNRINRKRNATCNQLQGTLNLIFRRCLSLSGQKPLGSLGHKIYDVVIVGGGAMGSSSAYFLANRMSFGMGKICVIEQDPTVSHQPQVTYYCSTFVLTVMNRWWTYMLQWRWTYPSSMVYYPWLRFYFPLVLGMYIW